MEFCVELLKTIEWAVDVDPQVITNAIGDGANIKQLASVLITEWSQPRGSGVDLARFPVLKRGRLIARLLTITSRDHKLASVMGEQFSTDLWLLTMRNL